jgi:hypothetical protein
MFDLADENCVIAGLDNLADAALHHSETPIKDGNAEPAGVPTNSVESIHIPPGEAYRKSSLILREHIHGVMRT